MNLKELINSKAFFYSYISVLIVIFIVLKISDLFLPYFWDEAWSYFPVIYKMVQTAPTLFPNENITPDFYKGHPLLFYFLSATWIKFFGHSIWISKVFPLLIAVLYIVLIAVFSKKYFGLTTSFISVPLTIVQSVFFVQSSFLLPEILLALFTLAAIHFYFQQKKWLTILFLTLALYTKETAVVIWISIAFFEFLKLFKARFLPIQQTIITAFYMLLPIIFISVFFLIQYLNSGWIFYPEHINFISLSSFFDRFSGYTAYIFIYHGRNLLAFASVIAFLFIMISNKNQLIEKKTYLIFLAFFVLAYLVFSSLNFYSPRYILSILPIVIVLFGYFLQMAFKKFSIVISSILIAIIFLNNVYTTIYKGENNDHSLGYRDIVEMHKQVVRYCEEQQWHNEIIYTHFLMNENLTRPELGYLTNKKPFNKVSVHWNMQNVKFAIVSSIELDKEIYSYLKSKAILKIRFEKNNSWAEIFEIPNKTIQ